MYRCGSISEKSSFSKSISKKNMKIKTNNKVELVCMLTRCCDFSVSVMFCFFFILKSVLYKSFLNTTNSTLIAMDTRNTKKISTTTNFILQYTNIKTKLFKHRFGQNKICAQHTNGMYGSPLVASVTAHGCYVVQRTIIGSKLNSRLARS